MNAPKVVQFKAAKSALKRKHYAGTMLEQFDRLGREARRQLAEKRVQVERKAREAL